MQRRDGDDRFLAAASSLARSAAIKVFPVDESDFGPLDALRNR